MQGNIARMQRKAGRRNGEGPVLICEGELPGGPQVKSLQARGSLSWNSGIEVGPVSPDKGRRSDKSPLASHRSSSRLRHAGSGPARRPGRSIDRGARGMISIEGYAGANSGVRGPSLPRGTCHAGRGRRSTCRAKHASHPCISRRLGSPEAPVDGPWVQGPFCVVVVWIVLDL
jgi:hypothetical protein